MHHKRNCEPAMSTPFYDLASLVVVPSGYKASKVYAQKPLTTDGQLTFTRASNATRVASNGLIEKVRTNLILQSNTFNTTWASAGTGGATVTSGQADPDGGTSAWLLAKGGVTGRIEQNIAMAANEQTFSVVAKKGTSNFLYVIVFDGTTGHSSYFNLDTGAVGSQSNAVGSIVPLGGGWYRCSVTSTNASATGVIQIYQSDANGSVTGTTGNLYIYQSQFENGVATPYIATTSAAVSVGPVANVPRLDYLNSSCPRLLLEPQRTNLALWSENFDNAYWTKVGTVSANAGTSPDGYVNADKLAAGTSNYISRSITTTIGQAYTASVYIKSANAGQSASLRFNFSAGQPIPAASVQVDTMDEWQRVSATFTATTTLTIMQIGEWSTFGYGPTEDILIWGAQIEAGAYATSYIPTLGAAVTRGADVASKTGISSLIGQTEGTLFADFIYDGDFQHRFSVAVAGSNNNWIFIGIPESNTGNGRVYIRTNSITHLDTSTGLGSGTFVKGQRYKVAFAYKSGDWAIYINGTLKSSGSQTFTTPSPSFDGFYPSGTGPSSGAQVQLSAVDFNQNILFKTRLTNAQLAELTTL